MFNVIWHFVAAAAAAKERFQRNRVVGIHFVKSHCLSIESTQFKSNKSNDDSDSDNDDEYDDKIRPKTENTATNCVHWDFN